MKPNITLNDLLLDAINGSWTTLEKTELPEWLTHQSGLEQKMSLVGVALMESMIPEVHKGESIAIKEQVYPRPTIVPLLQQVLLNHKYHLLNEVLILLHQSELPLPAFVLPDLLTLSEKVFTQKANLRYLMPAWIADHELPSPSWETYRQIPTLDDWTSTNDEERLFLLRHLKLNGQEVDPETLEDFWSSSKTPVRMQILNIIKAMPFAANFLQDKLNVRSKELQEVIRNALMKAKSTIYISVLEIIRSFWEKEDPRLQTMSASILEDIHRRIRLSTSSTSRIYHYLDPSDLNDDFSQWKALRNEALSDEEVKDFLLGALFFEHLGQIKFWMDHERFFLDTDMLNALADLSLANYNLISDHIIRNGKMKSSDLIHWLLCRKQFMSKPLSKTVAEFIGKSINQDVEPEALTDLIHDFCFRCDPTIYQYLLNIRERNTLASKNILIALDKGLEDLRIRLQFRNLLSTN